MASSQDLMVKEMHGRISIGYNDKSWKDIWDMAGIKLIRDQLQASFRAL